MITDIFSNSVPKWNSVDIEMKTAIDHKDNQNYTESTWWALKSLESVIKIISDEKKFTHGKESGVANYLDNISSKKNGNWLPNQEHDFLIYLFKDYRNPISHGGGSSPTKFYNADETNEILSLCITWAKILRIRHI